MDYAMSDDQGIGVVIKHREWVEGTEIGYWILDIGVGMGSNNTKCYPQLNAKENPCFPCLYCTTQTIALYCIY